MFLLFVRYLHGRSHAPINASRLSMNCWFREAGPYHETHCKLRSSAAVGTYDTSTPYSSPKGDRHYHNEKKQPATMSCLLLAVLFT